MLKYLPTFLQMVWLAVSLIGAVIYNQPITTQSVQISMNDFGTTGLYFAQIIDPNNAIVDSKKIVLQ